MQQEQRRSWRQTLSDRYVTPTLESRVSGPLGRHGVLVWAGCGRSNMLCYVTNAVTGLLRYS